MIVRSSVGSYFFRVVGENKGLIFGVWVWVLVYQCSFSICLPESAICFYLVPVECRDGDGLHYTCQEKSIFIDGWHMMKKGRKSCTVVWNLVRSWSKVTIFREHKILLRPLFKKRMGFPKEWNFLILISKTISSSLFLFYHSSVQIQLS